MIAVGSPWILGTAAAGALVTVVLHFLSVRRPPVLLLPTARFLPMRPVRAVSRSARPSDLWLLLIRVSALLLMGIALAGVTWNSGLVTHGRVIVVDRRINAAQLSQLRARVGAIMRGRAAGDTATRVVVVDSTARVLSVSEMRAFRAESLLAIGGTTSLSAMLLAGVRAASVLVRDERNVDSVELVLVTPLIRSVQDAAFQSARSMWPGRVRVIDVAVDAGSADSTRRAPGAVLVGTASSNAVRSAFAARGVLRSDSARTPSKDSKTQSTNGAITQTLIEWPEAGIPRGWTPAVADTNGALIARGRALVWPFVRTSRAPDSLLLRARPIAWWSDGAVAAIETKTDNGCLKQVGVAVRSSSDVLQGEGARPLLSALSAPCGGEVDARALSDNARKLIEGPRNAAPASAFTVANSARTPFASIMLLFALLLLALEWWMRDREGAGAAITSTASSHFRNVA